VSSPGQGERAAGPTGEAGRRERRRLDWGRVSLGEAVAALAAIALLFLLALDWWSTPLGEEARRLERNTEPRGGVLQFRTGRDIEEDADFQADHAERNGWRPGNVLDGIVLGGVLITIVLALAAVFHRAVGGAVRRGRAPPVATAGVVAIVTAALLAERIVARAIDAEETVAAGAPLAMLALGLVALGAALTLRGEGRGRPGAPASSEPARGGAA
jgi:hypothetical protein